MNRTSGGQNFHPFFLHLSQTQSKTEGAKKTNCEVLKATPDQSELLQIIGLIENELGNYEAAEFYLCKAINLQRIHI